MTVNEDDRQFAAEYVLGTLPAALRLMVRARTAEESEIAALVKMWQERLAPLHELAVPIAPPADLWPQIAAGLPRPVVAPSSRTEDADSVAELTPDQVAMGKAAVAAAVPEFEVPPSEKQEEEEPNEADALARAFASGAEREAAAPEAAELEQEPAGPAPSRAPESFASPSPAWAWRLASGVLAVALMGVGGTFIYREVERSGAQSFLASLQEGRAASVFVRIDPSQGVLVVRPLLDPAPEGKTYQLWIVPEGQMARSLGTFSGAFTIRSEVIRRLGARGLAKATLQVTLEPEGGSREFSSGDVLYSGRLMPE